MIKWFNKLPPMMQVLVVLIALAVVYFVYVKLSTFIKTKKAITETNTQIQAYQTSGITQSFTNEEFEQMASSLYTAMKGLGTDEQIIFEVYGALKNDLDFIKLKSAFGTRDGYDLQTWLDDDLSQANKDTVNGLLANNGISKRI